jgi:hypothetical protein
MFWTFYLRNSVIVFTQSLSGCKTNISLINVHFSVTISYWQRTMKWAEWAISRHKILCITISQRCSRFLRCKTPLQLRISENLRGRKFKTCLTDYTLDLTTKIRTPLGPSRPIVCWQGNVNNERASWELSFFFWYLQIYFQTLNVHIKLEKFKN